MTPPLLGRAVSRVDGRRKVTGGADYAADQHLDNMAYGYLVTSTVGRGTIRSMDVKAARRSPGVVDIYTPFNPLKLYTPVQTHGETRVPLQDTDVRYFGQIIGLVVAETLEQARDAAALVTADYDARPAKVQLSEGLPGTVPTLPGQGGEHPSYEHLAPGVRSIDEALEASEVTLEATYTHNPQHHGAMEPHATVALWRDGHLTAYSGTQGPMVHARLMAQGLGVDTDQVRVVNPYVGGAFGSKVPTWPDSFLTAAAARALGRPVKLVLTREQVFVLGGHRPAATQTLRLGASRRGVLNAISHNAVSTLSASGTHYMTPAGQTSRFLYATANLSIDQRVAILDIPPACAMRAPNEGPGLFALETALDELAVQLGIDPIELRMRNYATKVPGEDRTWSSKHLEECYRVGARRFGWSDRDSRPRRRVEGEWLIGTGMASALYPAGRGPVTVRISLRDDGTAVVSTATADIGTGMWTAVAMMGADSLELPLDRVVPKIGDSALPPGAMAVGSTATGNTAPGVFQAAQDVKAALIELAVTHARSPLHGLKPEDITYSQGRLRAGGRSVPFADVLAATDRHSVESTASVGPGEERQKYAFHCFGAHFAEVRVNRYTGEARVNRFTSVLDIGRVINAKTARSQVEGGVIFGIGHALLEGCVRDEGTGRIANGTFGDYLLPVNADIPPIDVHFLDHPDTIHNPLGARGVGELGACGSSAAVGNAIYHATGIRVRDLPITLDKLLG
ncbi:xanthine dehydrogenase family protein molybdopterin-binding subunit [Streptomyces sp. PSKA30]|uniref:xanthine dehydrogenase family protein molybdopterin-binding subunit n=1 Tax=Streptomyces sp. PSKA30 TaxID=2874597 RepID=UPI001CD14333|nr:xanthine dehydrogenase family protein molybdopterin-binding subunit [Streptomyces sp. PSKA30]MBZ9645675.1 xanthine dehydrogenase family protein molybdopterin-binding subunit [Streptomyces sp. PSKA30]